MSLLFDRVAQEAQMHLAGYLFSFFYFFSTKNKLHINVSIGRVRSVNRTVRRIGIVIYLFFFKKIGKSQIMRCFSGGTGFFGHVCGPYMDCRV